MKNLTFFTIILFIAALEVSAQVGIGTTTPSQLLHLYNATGNTAILYQQNGGSSGSGQQGANSPASSAYLNNPFGCDWDNTTGIIASDDNYATASLDYFSQLNADQYSDALAVTNFNFSIPVGATIMGVVLEIEKKSQYANVVYDDGVILVSSESGISENKAHGEAWPVSDSYVTYGSGTDLWGTTLTPDIVNSPAFGVHLFCYVINDYSSVAYVDHIRMTIYYTTTASTLSWMAGADYNDGGKFKISQSDNFGTNNHFVIQPAGNIGIGTSTPGEKLEVNGNIKGSSFIATMSGTGAYKYNIASNMIVPDYVFDQYYHADCSTNPEYKMLGLSELSAYLQTNRHLPGVPSRDDLLRDGSVNMQGFSMLTLEKVEENTLYILELSKANQQMQLRNDLLQKQIDELKTEIELLKKK